MCSFACKFQINFILVLVTCLSPVLVLSTGDSLTLTVLHTNDVHSRFLQTNKHGGSCSQENAVHGECYGGFSRLHHKVCIY